MARIVISGYYGFGNIGDEAILAGILASLKAVDPSAELLVLSARPEETERSHGVRAADRRRAAGVAAAIRNADLLLSGGGSLLQDITSRRSLYYYLGIITMAQLMGKRTMLYASGIGPISSRAGRLATRLILNRADLITLREEDSLGELGSIGVSRPPIRVTADPAFLLPRPVEDVQREVMARFGLRPDGAPAVLLSVRAWRGGTEAEVKKDLAAMAAAVSRLSRLRGVRVLLFPLQPRQDLPAARLVQEAMAGEAKIGEAKIVEGIRTPTEALALIGAAEMVVGMRLHSLILAAVAGVPMAGISYDPKVASFLRLVEQPEAGRVPGLDQERLASALLRAWDEREDLRSNLARHGARMIASAKETAGLALDLIRGRGGGR